MRDKFTAEQRSLNVYHHIDPGFINYRECFSAFGSRIRNIYQQQKREENDHVDTMLNHHLMVSLVLNECRKREVKTLSESLQNPQVGEVFSSTEVFLGTDEDLYEKQRVQNQIKPAFEYPHDIFTEFTTTHFIADTGRTEQGQENKISIVGKIRRVEKEVIIYPLIMGAPTLEHPKNHNLDIRQDLIWFGFDWYQIFPEDIDEFSDCSKIDRTSCTEWEGYMGNLSEKSVKNKLAEILGDKTKKDWGGELNDHYTATIHLNNKRITSAFLLKGPTNFSEMTPEMLGKRADQIFRLANTPANLLIVQHSHDIGEAVHATLRAFSVAPHNPRRYCLIDGRDTYRILKAYDQLD